MFPFSSRFAGRIYPRMALLLALATIPCMPVMGAPARPANVPQEARFDEKYSVWVANGPTSQVVWYAAGAKKAEGGLKQDHRDGPWKFWHENGQPRAEGSYVDGRMEGPWKHYYKSGAIQSEGEYLHNAKSGAWIIYFDGGRRKAEGNYVGGLKNGLWTEYYPAGGIFFKGQYVSDVAHGAWTYYFENGGFFQAGRFAEDVRVGVWKICVTPAGPCGEENFRQNEPPRVSGLPKAEEFPKDNDVELGPKDPSAALDSSHNWDHE